MEKLHEISENTSKASLSAYDQLILKGKLEGKEEGLREGKKEGLREGLREGKKEIIRNFLLSGKLSVDEIAQYSQVSKKIVLEIQKEIQEQ